LESLSKCYKFTTAGIADTDHTVNNLLCDLHQSENKKITISLTLRAIILYVCRSYAAYARKIFFNFYTANCNSFVR